MVELQQGRAWLEDRKEWLAAQGDVVGEAMQTACPNQWLGHTGGVTAAGVHGQLSWQPQPSGPSQPGSHPGERKRTSAHCRDEGNCGRWIGEGDRMGWGWIITCVAQWAGENLFIITRSYGWFDKCLDLTCIIPLSFSPFLPEMVSVTESWACLVWWMTGWMDGDRKMRNGRGWKK